MVKLPKSFWLIAPYAAWMVLMAVLPATATAYAVRTAATAALFAAAAASLKLKVESLKCWKRSDLVLGLAVGLVVFAIWILPEQFDWVWYRKWCIVGEGGTQAVAEANAAMIVVRLIGSAFVISVAEELFFRKWLISFAGFWWMVALFAVEHGDCWAVGAAAGVVYGLVARRFGLPSAIAAHAVTNFALGLLVIFAGRWEFWR